MKIGAMNPAHSRHWWMIYHWHPAEYEQWTAMPPMAEYLSVHSSSRSVFGVGTGYVAFGHADRLFVEFVLARHGFQSILEFGTWSGVTSLYLGIAAAMRSIPFWTCDIEDMRLEEVKRMWLWNMLFEKVNLLGGVTDVVVSRVEQPDVFLLVDNGNKEYEAETYGKYMAQGSMMMIHDWETEVKQEPMVKIMADNGFVPLYFDVAEHFMCHCRLFQRQTIPWEKPQELRKVE